MADEKAKDVNVGDSGAEVKTEEKREEKKEGFELPAEKMKAIVVPSYNEDLSKSLRLIEVPLVPPGPNQVLIKGMFCFVLFYFILFCRQYLSHLVLLFWCVFCSFYLANRFCCLCDCLDRLFLIRFRFLSFCWCLNLFFSVCKRKYISRVFFSWQSSLKSMR